MNICQGEGNRFGPRKRYRCQRCGTKKADTQFLSYSGLGTHGKICRRCRDIIAREPGPRNPIDWTLIKRYWSLTPKESKAVTAAARVYLQYQRREPGAYKGERADDVIQACTSDPIRQCHLLGAVVERARELGEM